MHYSISALFVIYCVGSAFIIIDESSSKTVLLPRTEEKVGVPLKKEPDFTDIDSVDCETNPLTSEGRLQILNDHNYYRSELANGEAKFPGK